MVKNAMAELTHFRDELDQLRKDVKANPEKVVARMEEKLADNIRIMEEGWRSVDRAKIGRAHV